MHKRLRFDFFAQYFPQDIAEDYELADDESVLSILNANRKIRKRTDTDVAFTQEYSRVLIFHRERERTN